MFKSSYTASALVFRVEEELGLANSPSRTAYYESLSDCLSRLYASVICEKRRYPLTAYDGVAELEDIIPPDGCDIPRLEDITSAQSGDRQLRFLPYSMFSLGETGYYTLADTHLFLADPADGENLSVDVILRPMRYSVEEDGTVPFPDEFISLLLCRMRGDILRLAGEDAEAAKWLGEYNTMLDEFALWLAASRARRGG